MTSQILEVIFHFSACLPVEVWTPARCVSARWDDVLGGSRVEIALVVSIARRDPNNLIWPAAAEFYLLTNCQ